MSLDPAQTSRRSGRTFLEHFQADEPVITRMNKFVSCCRQLPTRDVRQYATCLKSLAARYFGTDTGEAVRSDRFQDETTICRFIAGLKEGIKAVVLRRYPKTLAEAIAMAIQEEESAALLGKGHTVNTVEDSAPTQSSDLLTRTLNEMMKRMEATEKNVPRLSSTLNERAEGQRAGNFRSHEGWNETTERPTNVSGNGSENIGAQDDRPQTRQK